MELTQERLQEIKDFSDIAKERKDEECFGNGNSVLFISCLIDSVDELIAAYEASQRELAELLQLDKGDIHIEKINKLITALTTKLEASQQELFTCQHELDSAQTFLHAWKKETANLREQLEASQQRLASAEAALVSGERCFARIQTQRNALLARLVKMQAEVIEWHELKDQLAEANVWRGVWKDRCLFGVTKLREYKKQLAKAKGLIADGVTDEINLMKQLTKAQEQLAASQAEVERLRGELTNSSGGHTVNLRKQLVWTQAEVERLRKELRTDAKQRILYP